MYDGIIFIIALYSYIGSFGRKTFLGWARCKQLYILRRCLIHNHHRLRWCSSKLHPHTLAEVLFGRIVSGKLQVLLMGCHGKHSMNGRLQPLEAFESLVRQEKRWQEERLYQQKQSTRASWWCGIKKRRKGWFLKVWAGFFLLESCVVVAWRTLPLPQLVLTPGGNPKHGFLVEKKAH